METNAKQLQLSGHNGAIYDACWDKYRQEWITAGGDGVVAAWDESLDINGRALLQSTDAFYAVHAIESGPIAGTESGEIMLFNSMGEPRKIAAHHGGIFELNATGSNGFFCGGGDGRITQWDSGSLQGEWHWKNATKIRTIASAQHGMFIGSSSGKGIILPDLSSKNSLNKGVEVKGHEGGIYAAVYLPEKSVWLTGGRDGHLRAWSLTGQELIAIPAHEAAIYRVVVGGNQLYTASRDKSVKSWNTNDLSFSAKWNYENKGAKRSVNALCLGGKETPWLLAAGDDRQIRLMQLG